MSFKIRKLKKKNKNSQPLTMNSMKNSLKSANLYQKILEKKSQFFSLKL